MSLSVEQEYVLTDTSATLTQKDWAGGSGVPETVKELVIPLKPNASFEENIEMLTYAPKFPKMADELIVNALDHIIRCLGTAEPVTQISITFDPAVGSISVFNDGRGIPVAVHKDATKANGKETYVVEFIMGQIFQGSNRDRDATCIIGGTNGVGAKFTNANSVKFTVETTDMERGLHYVQTWTDNLRVCGKPVIKAATARTKGTRITYWPDYELMSTAHPRDDPVVADTIDKILRTRAVTAAIYAGFATTYNLPQGVVRPKKPVVTYNSQKLTGFTKTVDIANVLFPGMPAINMRMYATEELTAGGNVKQQCSVYTMDWDMTVVAVPKIKKDVSTLTIINGIIAKDGGHIKRAQKIIAEAICAKLKGRLTEADIEKVKKRIGERVFIILCCQIPNPGWEGQRKDRLSFKADKFSHYTIEKKAATAIGNVMADVIADDYVQKAPTKGKQNRLDIPLSIYRRATEAGNSRVKGKILLLTEGNSAKTSTEYMGLSPATHGVLALGGVILNARRETKVSSKDGDNQYVIPTKKFVKNKMMEIILAVTGLNVNKKQYASTDKLEYDKYILAIVDQDLDGKGNILGLVLNMVAQLWPGLFRQGYIRWLETPVIRAYPKSRKGNTVKQFYSMEKYEEWTKEVGPKISNYTVKYYKGLARHNKDEWVNIAKTLDQHTYVYVYEEGDAEWFEIYFGNDPDKRKVVLRHPPLDVPLVELRRIERTRKISCGTHLRKETHAYQLDNIERKLLHEIDGQNQSGRKIIDAIIDLLPANDEPRVANFAGLIVNKKNYHHGEASLESSLFTRMRIYPGGMQLPFIVPSGNAGSRADGGKDHGSSRYVHLRSNKKLNDLLFPKADYCMLEFQFFEGERCEPKYFIPIIPLAVCETIGMPGTGWNYSIWARDLKALINNIRYRIYSDGSSDSAANVYELPPYMYKNAKLPFDGHYVGDVCYGAYTVDSDGAIIITELPLGEWTIPYITALQAQMASCPDEIFSVDSISTDPNTVRIRVTLAPGTLEKYSNEWGMSMHDATISYFKLRANMTTRLNLMGEHGGVVEHARYIDIVNTWYPYRKRLYERRCERISVVYNLKIGLLENVIRYVRESNSLGMAKCAVSIMIERLTTANYVRYHRATVENPGFMPTEEIIPQATLSDKANYDYLIDMSDRDKSAESLVKYEAKLAKLRAEATKHESDSNWGRFHGAKIWLEELTALEELYEEGCATNWCFGEFDDLVYD